MNNNRSQRNHPCKTVSFVLTHLPGPNPKGVGRQLMREGIGREWPVCLWLPRPHPRLLGLKQVSVQEREKFWSLFIILHWTFWLLKQDFLKTKVTSGHLTPKRDWKSCVRFHIGTGNESAHSMGAQEERLERRQWPYSLYLLRAMP